MISNTSLNLKRMAIGATAVLSMLACRIGFAETTPATAPASSQPAATRPNISFGPVTAVINSDQVSRDEFQFALEQAAGPKVFEEILQFYLAQQACQSAGFPVGPEQFKAQAERLVASLKEQGVTDAQMPQALGMVMQRQGLTPYEFDLKLKTSAFMAALAKGHGDVTPEQVEDAYKRDTGKKYSVVVTYLSDMSQAAGLRNLVVKEQKSIVDAARQMSLQQRPALISDVATEKEVPKAIMDITRKLKDGELSVFIPLETTFQMLYLEKAIPAQDIKPADVASYKGKLKAKMIQAGEEQWANNHMQNLMSKARIEFKDPILSQMYQQIAAARTAQQEAAKTQPASPPATMPAAPAK